jgi:hypothetical protein
VVVVVVVAMEAVVMVEAAEVVAGARHGIGEVPGKGQVELNLSPSLR